MKISEDTSRVLEFLNGLSEDRLRKANDMAVLMEIAATYDGAELFASLVFTGKSIWNLFQKIKKTTGADEGAELLQRELIRSITELRQMLSEIVSYGEEDDIKRFNEIYLPDTRGTMLNIIDLSHDLMQFKNMQSKSKEISKNIDKKC